MFCGHVKCSFDNTAKKFSLKTRNKTPAEDFSIKGLELFGQKQSPNSMQSPQIWHPSRNYVLKLETYQEET